MTNKKEGIKVISGQIKFTGLNMYNSNLAKIINIRKYMVKGRNIAIYRLTIIVETASPANDHAIPNKKANNTIINATTHPSL